MVDSWKLPWSARLSPRALPQASPSEEKPPQERTPPLPQASESTTTFKTWQLHTTEVVSGKRSFIQVNTSNCKWAGEESKRSSSQLRVAVPSIASSFLMYLNENMSHIRIRLSMTFYSAYRKSSCGRMEALEIKTYRVFFLTGPTLKITSMEKS